MIMRRGLGQTYDDQGNLIISPTDTSTPPVIGNPFLSPGAISSVTPGFTQPGLPLTPAPSTAPAAPSYWDQIIGGLLGQGAQLAGRVVAPTTTIQRGPNGQVLIQTPASSTANTSLLAAGTGTGLTSNWVLLAGLAVAAFIAIKAFSK
jgi:hypothetical protein